jgi:hypothetical protein
LRRDRSELSSSLSSSSSLSLDRRLAALGLCDGAAVLLLVGLRCGSLDLDACGCDAAFSRLTLDLLVCGGA